MPSAVRIGDMHFCAENGPNSEATQMIVNGSPNVTINGLPAVRVGDTVSCRLSGASTIAEGSSKVTFNGQPAARTGDSTDNGGSLLQGSGNVFIGDGHARVTIGNNAKVKFGNQAKIYLSSSSASESASSASSTTPTNTSWMNRVGTALVVGGIPFDESGVGEAMQIVGGGLKLAAKLEAVQTAAEEAAVEEEAASSAAEVKPVVMPPLPPPMSPRPPKQCSNDVPSYKKLDSNYLKKKGIDPHAFKDSEIGGNTGHWDIQMDKCSGKISLISKKGVILSTDYSSLDELAEYFPFKK